jgi:hypothetical protein
MRNADFTITSENCLPPRPVSYFDELSPHAPFRGTQPQLRNLHIEPSQILLPFSLIEVLLCCSTNFSIMAWPEATESQVSYLTQLSWIGFKEEILAVWNGEIFKGRVGHDQISQSYCTCWATVSDLSSRGFCPEFIGRFGRSLGWWWHSHDGQWLEGASPLSGNLCGEFPRTFGATIIALRQ